MSITDVRRTLRANELVDAGRDRSGGRAPAATG
jgi:hypothetical protein